METLVILSKFFKVKGDCNGIPLPMLSRISMKNQNLSAPVKLMLLLKTSLAIFIGTLLLLMHIYSIYNITLFSISMRCSHLNISDIKSCIRST